MYNSDKILNTICELCTSSGIQLTGVFIKPGSNIWFTGRINLAELRTIDRNKFFDLTGTVNDVPVYIGEASLSTATTNGLNPEYANINILPHHIIIGEKPQEKYFITYVSASFPELNYFFQSLINHIFDQNFEDKIILEKEHLNLKSIIYSKNKQLSISSGTKIDSKNGKLNLETMYSANISFDTKQSLEVSIKEIAVFRLFLILLSDSFIPLPSELIIYSKDTKLIEQHSNTTIWLNDNRIRYPTRENKPFLIVYEDIKNDFEIIWNSWVNFYEQPLNSPMIELIYQIISNESVGLNRFLNICQALEVYSTQYRNEECNDLFNFLKSHKLTTAKKITLQMRIQDLLILNNEIFSYNDDEIYELSSDIADLRNYYTHYNPSRQRKLEEKYSNIKDVYTKFDHTLYSLLLATIYKEIDVPVLIVKNSLTNFEARFGKTLQDLFEGPD